MAQSSGWMIGCYLQPLIEGFMPCRRLQVDNHRVHPCTARCTRHFLDEVLCLFSRPILAFCSLSQNWIILSRRILFATTLSLPSWILVLRGLIKERKHRRATNGNFSILLKFYDI